LRRLLKVFNEVAEWPTSGRLFHTRAAATPNARSATVRHRVRGTISLWVADDRRRCRELLSAAQCKENDDDNGNVYFTLATSKVEYSAGLLPGTPARCDCDSGRRVLPVGI